MRTAASHREIASSRDARVTAHARSKEGDRLLDHVIRGQKKRSEISTSELPHDLEDALVVLIAFVDEGEDEARVKEDHRGRRLPYRYVS